MACGGKDQVDERRWEVTAAGERIYISGPWMSLILSGQRIRLRSAAGRVDPSPTADVGNHVNRPLTQMRTYSQFGRSQKERGGRTHTRPHIALGCAQQMCALHGRQFTISVSISVSTRACHCE